MLTFLLVACTGEPEITIDDTGGGGGKDSGKDTVDPVEAPTFTFTFSGSTTGRALLVQYIDDTENWITGDVVTSAALTGSSQSIHVDDPPDAVQVTYDEYPDTRFGFAAAAVYNDDDGDVSQDFGELFVATDIMLLWIDGEVVPDVFEAGGAELGWNALAISSLSGDLEVYDPLAVPMEIHEPRDEITVGGEYIGSTADVGVLAAPYVMLDGGMVTSYLYDEPLDGTSFTATFTGEPPADHFSDDDGDGFGEAGELLISYTDAAPPDGYGTGDTPKYPACFDGEIVLLYWIDGFDDLARATIYGSMGFSAGWNALTTDGGDGVALLADANLQSLTMAQTCGF